MKKHNKRSLKLHAETIRILRTELAGAVGALRPSPTTPDSLAGCMTRLCGTDNCVDTQVFQGCTESCYGTCGNSCVCTNLC